MKKLYLFIVIFILCLIGCPSEYAPECGGKKGSPSSETVTPLSVTEVSFDSLNYSLSAKVNTDDGREITAVCNGKTQTAKAGNGKISWDMSSSFYKGIKGGKDYNVSFSANGGYSGTVTASVTYWPKVEYTLASPNVVTIYNGSAKSYKSPAYTINYIVDSVNLSMQYKLYDEFDSEIDRNTSGWKLANMLDYLSDSDNAGCRVEVHFSVTPKCDGGDKLAAKGFVTYLCKADVPVHFVEIEQVYDVYKAFLYNEDGNSAGGKITYTWQLSDNGSNWSDILKDVTSDTYTPTESDFGKRLRVTIKQTYGDQTITKTSDSISLMNVISEANLYYDGVVLVGTAIDFAKIKGTIVNVIGGEVSAADVSFDLTEGLSGDGILSYSHNVYITVKKHGYEDYKTSIFVPVQFVMIENELPTLSENGREITIGNVAFEFAENTDISDYANIEFSSDKGATWGSIPNGEFPAISGDKLLVRRKKTGTPNTRGYIKESEPLVIIVTNQNIGLKQAEPDVIEVTDVLFDSVHCILSANINLPNGTEVTISCNGVEKTLSVVSGGIITGMASSFREGVIGGYTYDVSFRADGCVGANVSLRYFPKVQYSLNVKDNVIVYNGGANSFVIPELTTNYGDYIREDLWFKLFDTTTDSDGRFVVGDEIKGIDTSNWTVVDMMMFLADINNVNKSLQVHFKLTPICENREELSADGYVTFHCQRDVLVNSVTISRNKELFEALPHSSESDVSDDDTAGGVIAYQWQRSSTGTSDWTDISGATRKVYKLNKDDENKYIRVKIVQTYEEQPQSPIYSAASAKIADFVIQNNLYYAGAVPEGQKAGAGTAEDQPNGKVKGNVETYFAGKIIIPNGAKVIYDDVYLEEYYKPNVSKPLDYKLCRTNGEFIDNVKVFVTVCSVLDDDDVPTLSTAVDTITVGKVKFDVLFDGSMEISIDSGKSYQEFPTGEFTANVGDVLFIRRAVSGIPNTIGYLQESEPKTIAVTEANIGKKASGGGLIDGIEMPTLTLTKQVQNGMTFIIPHLTTAGAGYQYEFTWLIDGFPSSNWEGLGVSTNYKHELIIRNGAFDTDVYQIVCRVDVYLGSGATRYKVVTVSEQTSLVVE